MAEALRLGQSTEILPAGTALQKAQELWMGLDVEPRTLESGEEEKLVELNSTSLIRIASGRDINHNPFVKIRIVDGEKNIRVGCILSSNGRSSFEIGLVPTQITIGDFVTTLGRGNITFHVSPGIRHEEQVMSAFVNWAKESIDRRVVTEPPYILKVLPMKSEESPEPYLLD